MTRWDFNEEDHQWGIWFSCSYGQGNILLSRQVKGPVTMCWSRDSVPAKIDLSVNNQGLMVIFQERVAKDINYCLKTFIR